MKFTTDLIHNPNYKKHKVIRGVAFVIFLLYCTPAFFMLTNLDALIRDLSTSVGFRMYFLGVVIITLTYILIHHYTWKIKKIGKLTINEEGIHLSVNGETKTYDFPSLKQLQIIRNSTHHKKDFQFSKSYVGNNWIKVFKEGDEVEEYEFSIKSGYHNKSFDAMIAAVDKVMRGRLDFRSI